MDRKNHNKQIIPPKDFLTAPIFYAAAIPHLLIIVFYLIGNLSFLAVFLIFIAELIIDFIIYLVSLSLMSEKDVRQYYHSKDHKNEIILEKTIIGLVIIGFFSVLTLTIATTSYLHITTITNQEVKLIYHSINSQILIAIFAYFLAKILYLGINQYKYSKKQQPYIDQGLSFAINIITIALFSTYGIFITPFALIIPYLEYVAIIGFVILRALLDGALSYAATKLQKTEQQTRLI